jgi:hypothetical protein
VSSAEGRRYIRTEQFASLKDHVYTLVKLSGPFGRITPELVHQINAETPDGFVAYSNPVSGALSRLHNVDGKLLRLRERRGGFNVYVAPEFVGRRAIYPPRPPHGAEGNRLTPDLVLQVLEGLHEMIEEGYEMKDALNKTWREATAGMVTDIQYFADKARAK